MKPNDDTLENSVSPALPSRDWAATWLRRIELLALQSDHARLRKSQAEDAWWATQPSEDAGETEVTGPYVFADILNGLVDGVSPVNVLPVALAGESAPPWTALHYAPLWNRPGVATAFKVAVWLLGAFFVYLAILAFTPFRFRGVLNLAFPILVGAALWYCKTSSHSTGRIWLWCTMKTLGVAAIFLATTVTLRQPTTSALFSSLMEKTQTAWTHLRNERQPASQPAQTAQSVENAAFQPASENTTPETAPVVEENPAATPAPAEVIEEELDFADLAQHPRDWPREVTLKRGLPFPALLEGKVIGSMVVPKGATAQLVGLDTSRVTLRYQGATQTVAIADTDLEARVQTARRNIPQRAIAQAATPAPGAKDSLAKATTKTRVELPGLDVQATTYFGSKRP